MYFVRKFNIWNINCGQAFIFESRTDVVEKVPKLFEAGNVSTQEGIEPPFFGFMPDASHFELEGPEISCPMFSNTGYMGSPRNIKYQLEVLAPLYFVVLCLDAVLYYQR